MFLTNSESSQEKTCVGVSFLIKLQFWKPANLLKKAPIQVFSCEIWKFFKKNYFAEHLWTFTSKLYLKRDSNTGVFLWFCVLFKNTYFVKDLWMAGSETPVWGSLFNKVASLTTWRHLTVLERDSSTGISLWVLRNFQESFLATKSHMMLFFSFLQISEVCSLKSIYLLEQW